MHNIEVAGQLATYCKRTSLTPRCLAHSFMIFYGSLESCVSSPKCPVDPSQGRHYHYKLVGGEAFDLPDMAKRNGGCTISI